MRRAGLVIGAVALAGVVAAIAMWRRDAPGPTPEPIPTASAAAAAPAVPPAAAPEIPRPPADAATRAPGPLLRPLLPDPTHPQSFRAPLGAPQGVGVGQAAMRQPGHPSRLDQLLARNGAPPSPLADARAATDPHVALAAYDRYLAEFPAGALREEAMVGRAGTLETLGDKAKAAAAWRSVLETYPGSLRAPQARRRLIALER